MQRNANPPLTDSNPSSMLSNSGIILDLVFTLRPFFQRGRYIIWNYKTTVMPYQFSVLSEGQNVNPALDEDTSKECSKRIIFSIYRPNPFFCCLLYCNVKYKSYPASKGLTQMIYLIFPLMPWVLRDHVISFTTRHHSMSPAGHTAAEKYRSIPEYTMRSWNIKFILQTQATMML